MYIRSMVLVLSRVEFPISRFPVTAMSKRQALSPPQISFARDSSSGLLNVGSKDGMK